MRLQPAIWQVLNLAMVSLRRTSLVIARCPKISEALAYKIRYLHLSFEDIPCVQQASVCGGTYVRQTIICWCLTLGLLLIPGQWTTNINHELIIGWVHMSKCMCNFTMISIAIDSIIMYIYVYIAICAYRNAMKCIYIYIYIHDPIHVFIMMQCCVISIRKKVCAVGPRTMDFSEGFKRPTQVGNVLTRQLRSQWCRTLDHLIGHGNISRSLHKTNV